jgi:hypothetical protein
VQCHVSSVWYSSSVLKARLLILSIVYLLEGCFWTMAGLGHSCVVRLGSNNETSVEILWQGFAHCGNIHYDLSCSQAPFMWV